MTSHRKYQTEEQQTTIHYRAFNEWHVSCNTAWKFHTASPAIQNIL